MNSPTLQFSVSKQPHHGSDTDNSTYKTVLLLKLMLECEKQIRTNDYAHGLGNPA